MRMTVFDVETTGLVAREEDIIEVGIAHFDDGVMTDSHGCLVKPTKTISKKITAITGITNKDVRKKGYPWKKAAISVKNHLESADIWCGQNIDFDIGFITEGLKRLDMELEVKPYVDTMRVARRFIPSSELRSKSLGKLAAHFGVDLENSHRALHDCIATGEVLIEMCEVFEVSIEDLLSPKALTIGPYNIGKDPFEALYSGMPRYRTY